MNIVTAITITAPSFPPVLHVMTSVPNTALTNAMACRVLRQLCLGILKDRPLTDVSRPPTTVQFVLRPVSSRDLSCRDRSEPGGVSRTHIDKAMAMDIELGRAEVEDQQQKAHNSIPAGLEC